MRALRSTLSAISAVIFFANVTPILVPAASAVMPPPSDAPLSPAQTILFGTPHLASITQPETLTYSFVHAGPGAFTDQATLDVREIAADGARNVTALFLTGERRLPAPISEHFSGNPLVMLFLENDVRDMRRNTNLPAIHFRDQIREAFFDRATVTPRDVTWDGRVVAGTEVTLQPLKLDARVKNLPPFRDKTYRFVVSDAVPGGIAEISTDEPADAASGAPATTETLRLEKVTPK